MFIFLLGLLDQVKDHYRTYVLRTLGGFSYQLVIYAVSILQSKLKLVNR